MTRKLLLLTFIFAGLTVWNTATAQDDSGLLFNAKPKSMWELGLNAGLAQVAGDGNTKIGTGFGISIKKALDYTFSLRGDFNYDLLKSDFNTAHYEGAKSASVNAWMADLNVVMSLNNLIGRMNKVKKADIYSYAGVGAGAIASYTAEDASGNNVDIVLLKKLIDDGNSNFFHFNIGAGLSYKISSKFNIGIDHKVVFPFSKAGDYMDAARLRSAGVPTQNRDLVHYTSLRFNFNLGNADEKSEPLYWVSPFDLINQDLAEVKARPKLDLTDTDGDGIIDMMDQEAETPAGAHVDPRGVALDSDGDGIKDHEDKEPFSAPGYKVDSEGVAQVPNPGYMKEGDVNRIVDAKIAGIKMPNPTMEWYLPMIHFNDNRYSIKSTEYSKLHHVATVMKQNAGLRVVAIGYTDRRASDCYNNVLSYNRANAAIDYIVAKYGISRDRFILNWGGETETISPSNGSSLANRRVEFRVAKGEANMGRPNCGVSKAGIGGSSYSGSKKAGY